MLKNGLPNEQIYNFYSVDSANQKIAVGATFSEYDTSVYSGHHTIKVSTDMSKSMMITSDEITFNPNGKPQLEELKQYGQSVIMPTDLNNPVDINPANLEDYLKLKNLKISISQTKMSSTLHSLKILTKISKLKVLFAITIL